MKATSPFEGEGGYPSWKVVKFPVPLGMGSDVLATTPSGPPDQRETTRNWPVASAPEDDTTPARRAAWPRLRNVPVPPGMGVCVSATLVKVHAWARAPGAERLRPTHPSRKALERWMHILRSGSWRT